MARGRESALASRLPASKRIGSPPASEPRASRPRSWWLLALVQLAVVSAEIAPVTAELARAQESAPPVATAPLVEPSEIPRIAVLMLPTGQVDPAMTDALTELLISQVAARDEDVRIVGKEEFQANLGQGDAGSVECVESVACLGRVGVQLGVAEVIAGTIARRDAADGAVWAFNLNRFDVRSGALLGRVFREVAGGLDAILDALEESFPELYVRRVQPGRLVVRATIEGAEVLLDGTIVGVYSGEPVRRETVEPGTHTLVVRASGHRDFERELEVPEGATMVIEAALVRAAEWEPSPLIFVGAGIATASLAAAIALGIASQASPEPALSMRETIEGFYPARELEAISANVLFGVAAAGAVLSIAGVLLSGSREPEASERGAGVAVAPSREGAALIVRGRF